MTESTEAAVDTAERAGANGNARLYRVLAWVGIIAGVVFIVGAVFWAGFFAGRSAEGYGWHRGYQNGQMRSDGPMGGCPMMQMQPGGMGGMGAGGMGAGGMGGMGAGGMGGGGMKGPSSSMMPTPPMSGQR